MLVGALGLLQTLVTMVYGAHQFFFAHGAPSCDESPGFIYYCFICVDLNLKDLHVSLQFLLMAQTSFILHSKEITKMAAWLSLVVNIASTSLGRQ